MDLGYKPTTKISTNDLPWVVCEPPLVFTFNNATQLRFGIELTQAATSGDILSDEQLLSLGSVLLLAVQTDDGDEYDLGSKKAIQELIDSTHPRFVEDVIFGWFYKTGLSRAASKKKQRRYSDQSEITKNGISPN